MVLLNIQLPKYVRQIEKIVSDYVSQVENNLTDLQANYDQFLNIRLISGTEQVWPISLQ